jgi:rhodanese-related sulfurtransferase
MRSSPRRPGVLAAKQLKDIGFTNVTAVVMKVVEWRDRGYPFIKDESK